MNQKTILIGVAGVGAFLFGCTANLSHNNPKITPAFELITSAQESEAEAEKMKEIAATETKRYQCSIAETESTMIIETSFETVATTMATTIAETTAYIPETAPTTAETTTVEQIIEETTTTAYSPEIAIEMPVEDDAMLLLKVASCEAGGQGAEGMALVMRVVLNRCAVSGASVHDVVYCPEQFACVGSDLWNAGYIVADAYDALALIYAGWDASQGATYFCTPKHNAWHQSALTYLFTFGDHEFYK